MRPFLPEQPENFPASLQKKRKKQKQNLGHFQLRKVLAGRFLWSVIIRLFFCFFVFLVALFWWSSGFWPRIKHWWQPPVTSVTSFLFMGRGSLISSSSSCPARWLSLVFLPLSFLNQQVLPQSTAAAAAASPWQTTMLPDQSDRASLSLVDLKGLASTAGLDCHCKHTHIDADTQTQTLQGLSENEMIFYLFFSNMSSTGPRDLVTRSRYNSNIYGMRWNDRF